MTPPLGLVLLDDLAEEVEVEVTRVVAGVVVLTVLTLLLPDDFKHCE